MKLLGLAAPFLLVLVAACSVAPGDDAASSESAQTAAPCRAKLTMDGASAPGAWQDVPHASWGGAASVTGNGGALRLELGSGNDAAKLVLAQSATLEPGTYALKSVRARVTRPDGSCVSNPNEAWAEVGLVSGEDVPLDGAHFSPSIKQDLAGVCDPATVSVQAPGGGPLTATLASGGELAVAAKLGATGGGLVAELDDVVVECVSGGCMECAGSAPAPIDPPPPAAGCVQSGAVEACPSSIQVAQSFSVGRRDGDRQAYGPPTAPTTPHETVAISNGALTLTFLKSAMGARLYSAVANGKELLYQNPTPRVQVNWGQGGFPIFGGVESAWPVEEHGYYGNLDWQSSLDASVPNAITFVAVGQGKSVGGTPATVTIRTTVAAGTTSWRQRVELDGTGGAENMYYTNFMIDAGPKGNPSEIEAILPGISRAVVHSRGGADGFLPGEHGDFGWPLHDGRDVSRMNTTVRDWLGMFVTEGAGPSRTYGFFNHAPSAKFGLAVVALDASGFYPKFFCGHGITADASGSGKGYCELWFSPNARTFWDHPTLPATGKLVHDVRITPFFSRDAFDAAVTH